MKNWILIVVSIISMNAFACPDIPSAVKIGSEDFGNLGIDAFPKSLGLSEDGKYIGSIEWRGTLQNGSWGMKVYTKEGQEKIATLADTLPILSKNGDTLVTIVVEKAKGKLTIYEGKGTDPSRQNRLAVSYVFKVLPLGTKVSTNEKHEVVAAWEKEGKDKEELKEKYRLMHEMNVGYIEKGEEAEAGSVRAEKVEIPYYDPRAAIMEKPTVDLKGGTYRTKKAEKAGGCAGEAEKVN
jgi:hypothetical protein